MKETMDFQFLTSFETMYLCIHYNVYLWVFRSEVDARCLLQSYSLLGIGWKEW